MLLNDSTQLREMGENLKGGEEGLSVCGQSKGTQWVAIAGWYLS